MKIYLITIGIILIVLGLLFLQYKKPYQFDNNNCGMKDNRCEQGFVCKYATCILPFGK